ncbi:MAG: hypothetical protein ACKOC5_06560 [Chloroflexota bacterium]
MQSPPVVLISANAEWRCLRRILDEAPGGPPRYEQTPFGEACLALLEGRPFQFVHGGWGKIAAAASTQWAIDHYRPALLINLGTCGGFAGAIERGEIVLAERTIVYDIIEQMGDFDEHIAHYTTQLDLGWLKPPYPLAVRRTLLVSGDRDLVVEEAPLLQARYGAAAGDWESGAIAWVAARSHTPLLILRGVTDLVSACGGEAYGNPAFFEQATQGIMQRLVASLPGWQAELGG